MAGRQRYCVRNYCWSVGLGWVVQVLESVGVPTLVQDLERAQPQQGEACLSFLLIKRMMLTTLQVSAAKIMMATIINCIVFESIISFIMTV